MKKVILCIAVVSIFVLPAVAQDDDGPRSAKYLGPPLAPGDKAINFRRDSDTPNESIALNGVFSARSTSVISYRMIPINLPVGTTLKRIIFYAMDNDNSANLEVALYSYTQGNPAVSLKHIAKSTAGVASSTNYQFYQTGLFSHTMLEFRAYWIVLKYDPATSSSDDLAVSVLRLIYQ